MDVVSVNWWAVIVAAIVKYALGAIWYQPLFGKQWRALMGIPEGSRQDGFTTALIVGAITDLIMAYILARFIVHYTPISVGSGILVGFLAWIGFMATISLGQVFYEKKPFTLWLINNSYLLLSLLIMGAIIGWWHGGEMAAAAPAPAATP
jgi:hypothetical protein